MKVTRISRAADAYARAHLATDWHSGWAGACATGTIYTMTLGDSRVSVPLNLVAAIISGGCRESYGTVWLFTTATALESVDQDQ